MDASRAGIVVDERHEHEQYFFTAGEDYDLIFCDPPFFNVSLSRLFTAIRVLARGRFDHQLLLSYLRRRSQAVLGTFSRFSLEPTGFRPRYVTVQESERNDVELFGNLGAEANRILASLLP